MEPLISPASLTTLAIVLGAGMAAPMLCAGLARFVRIPVVVMEMLLGIVIGPGLLGLVTQTSFVAVMATIGMWFLFYGAGYETDFGILRGRVLATASGAWVACLVLAVLAGVFIATLTAPVATTPLVSGIFIGAALVSTGLGTILPMMRDAGQIDTTIGRAVISSGIIGQFTPLVALAILVGVFSPPIAVLTHIAFFAVVAGVTYLAKHGLPAFAARVQSATLDAGAQFGVRLQMFVCVVAVLLAHVLGVNLAIGAFGAGVVVRALLGQTNPEERSVIDRKVRGIIGGVFLPVFFINAGISFDLPGLLAQPAAFTLIPVFLVLMLVVRGIPGSATLGLFRDGDRRSAVPWRERASTSLLVGTGLAAVILMADLGLEAGAITSVMAAALMGAAKLSALIFPTVALNLARQASA